MDFACQIGATQNRLAMYDNTIDEKPQILSRAKKRVSLHFLVLRPAPRILVVRRYCRLDFADVRPSIYAAKPQADPQVKLQLSKNQTPCSYEPTSFLGEFEQLAGRGTSISPPGIFGVGPEFNPCWPLVTYVKKVCLNQLRLLHLLCFLFSKNVLSSFSFFSSVTEISTTA